MLEYIAQIFTPINPVNSCWHWTWGKNSMSWRQFSSLALSVPGALVAANAAVFLAGQLSPAAERALWLHATLVPGRRFERRPYTILTYSLHHKDVIHFAMNMVGLVSFGQAAGAYLRASRLLGLYGASAVAGGAAHLAIVDRRPGSNGAVLGASGAVLGFATFVQLLNPHGKTLVFLVLPLPNWLTVVLFGAYSVFSLARPETDRTMLAHAGHLGGMAAGAVAALAWRRGLLR